MYKGNKAAVYVKHLYKVCLQVQLGTVPTGPDTVPVLQSPKPHCHIMPGLLTQEQNMLWYKVCSCCLHMSVRLVQGPISELQLHHKELSESRPTVQPWLSTTLATPLVY